MSNFINYLRPIIVCSIFFVLLQGCMIHKLKVDKIDSDFNGISYYLENADTLSVFMTHGMGYLDFSFANPLIEGIQRSLKLTPIDTSIVYNDMYILKTITFRQNTKLIKFYLHAWFPVTSLSKMYLNYLDESEERLETMANIKSALINNSVSDVIMYQGAYRKDIKKGMTSTLSLIYQDNPHAKCVCIAESLGSKILIETLNDQLGKNDLVAGFTGNVGSVYLLSNQLPLLFLGDELIKARVVNESVKQYKEDDNIAFTESLTEFNKPIRYFFDNKLFNINPKIQFVAFSDPNDLLSYSIPDKNIYTERYNVTNVKISIAKKGYSWPFGKPRIVNPIHAHMNYSSDETVIRYLIEGGIY